MCINDCVTSFGRNRREDIAEIVYALNFSSIIVENRKRIQSDASFENSALAAKRIIDPIEPVDVYGEKERRSHIPASCQG